MAIEVKEGIVNINGDLKKVGARLKMDAEEEKRLVKLGFCKFIDEAAEKIETIKGGK